MKKVMIICTVLLTACTSDNDFQKGKQQLEQQGYTEVINTGHEYFCCSGNENFSTGFRAKTETGAIVTGCFCSSIGKGITIRFE